MNRSVSIIAMKNTPKAKKKPITIVKNVMPSLSILNPLLLVRCQQHTGNTTRYSTQVGG
jgi:hypothetical protein